MRDALWSAKSFLFLAFAISFPLEASASAAVPGSSARTESLPPLEKWEQELVDAKPAEQAVEFVVPVNYRIGRAVSPMVAASEGELFTFGADVKTWFAAKQMKELYRCWLEVEFLKGSKVIEAVASPELTGTRDEAQMLAVTAAVPPGATGLRAVICMQNKYWSIVDNRATVSNVRLLRLSGSPGKGVRIEATSQLANDAANREALFTVRGDWPDGTAVALSSSRGSIPPTVLLSQGSARVPLRYSAEDVGRATVTARLGEHSASATIRDPHAATLVLHRAVAEGVETPVLVQLSRDGEMLPGRYQATVKGIFVTPPWTVDLAPGEWHLRVSRGPRFRAVERTVEAAGGETVTLDEVALEPVVDLPKLGWYGGDADGDVYHGELVYKDVDARAAADIAQAMGLDWVGVGRWGVSGYGGPNPKTWGEARAAMQELSGPNFLFLWTDERPKSTEGHACFVGLTRPNEDEFGWAWVGTAGRPLRNFELLGVIRASGAATFVNHPLRWWMKGTRFNTNMYSSLAFDLCAAGRLDGFNINDKPANLQVWSMLLDQGYRVAATAGADFCLDRPGGPPPGLHRMYCFCPEGPSPKSLAEAVRQGHTVVSTGPTLLADIDGQPPGAALPAGNRYKIRARCWARGDQPDELQRLELWSHGKAIATRQVDRGSEEAEAVFDWNPEGERDWVAVRAVSRAGWAMTSAFYAGENWHSREPITCRLELDITGLTDEERRAATVEVWDGPPSLATSRRISESPVSQGNAVDVPVTATVVVKAPRDRSDDVTVYDAAGISELIETIASGAEREKPLLGWERYEQILRRCRQAKATVSF